MPKQWRNGSSRRPFMLALRCEPLRTLCCSVAQKLYNLIVIDLEASCWTRHAKADAASCPTNLTDRANPPEVRPPIPVNLPLSLLPDSPAGRDDALGYIPDDQQREIIEIGVCVVDLKTLVPIGRWSTLVRPVRSTISEYCTEVTSITAERLADAPLFARAIAGMNRWLGTVRLAQQNLPDAESGPALDAAMAEMATQPMASWGDFDRLALEAQCALDGVPYPFSHSHMNLKTMFPLFGRSKFVNRVLSLRVAMRTIGRELEGTHHQAEDDAANAAVLACAMLRKVRSRQTPDANDEPKAN